MSEPEILPPGGETSQGDADEKEAQPKGPSLALLYGLVALALAAAIGLALMIVLPFYRRR